MLKNKQRKKPFNAVTLWVRNHWVLALGLIGFIGLVANVFVFYPGYMSNDSMNQYMQASGQTPLGDWHPPVMVFVWSLLMKVTGMVGSLLIVQLLMLWTSVFIFAAIVYSKTRLRKLSLLPFLLPFIPFIFNISGVLWKDVQMAYALLLAVALIVAIMCYKKSLSTLIRIVCVVLIVLLILYAALLRYNALFAAVPILVVAVAVLGCSRKVILFSVVAFLVLFAGTQAIIERFVKAENPLSSVMLDDIVTVNSYDDILGMDINDELKNSLLNVQGCIDDSRFVNLYWSCATDNDRKNVSEVYYDDLKTEWVPSVVGNLPQYISYRFQSFSWFVFSQGDPYIWHPGINENEQGLEVVNARLGKSAQYYVKASYDVFSIFYKVWFWLIFSIGLLIYAVRSKLQYKGIVIALALSSIIYIAAYIPVVVATDYRYIYWPVIACVIALSFVFYEKRVHT